VNYTDTGALISDCNAFRYRLWRRWDKFDQVHTTLPIVMLNPSTADGSEDDATIKKCVGFADRHGFTGIEVVNLFAYRATDPLDMRRAGYPVGPLNDAQVRHVLNTYGGNGFLCAWGAFSSKEVIARVNFVRATAEELGVMPLVLETTQAGHPKHPLYISYKKSMAKFWV